MKTESDKRKICVLVGGGASAALLALEILKKRPLAFDLLVIDPSSRNLGRGLAYVKSDQGDLLNVPAERMGADPLNPSEFSEWLKIHHDLKDFIHWPFVPRSLYGDYLQEKIKPFLECDMRQIQGYVQSIQTHLNRYVLRLEDQTEIVTDFVVICTGYQRPEENQKLLELGDSSCANCLVIGSALSAIDFWNRKLKNPSQKVTFLSRHGLLPLPHLEKSTPLKLPALYGMTPTQVLKHLRTWHSQGKKEWQDIADSVRLQASSIWNSWTPSERKQFLRHLKSWWEVIRHRVPLTVHQKLLSDLESKRLTVLAARVISIDKKGNETEVEFRLRGQSVSRKESYDQVLSARGVTISQRLAGSIKKIPNVEVCENHFGYLNRGAERLWIIGPASKTAFWEITAIPEIRKQVSSVAQEIVLKSGEKSGWLRPLFLNPFLFHPRSIKEGYWKHFGEALRIAGKLLACVGLILIHAVFPFLFVDSVSVRIRNLNRKLILRRFRSFREIFSLVFIFSFLITSSECKALTFSSLKNLIEEKKVESIENLLPLLPEGFRSHYVLMFQSRSLQSATYQNPRAILYGDDASFILSFNGDETEKGYDALETMEFNPEKKEFYYHEITFSRNSKEHSKVSFSETNPERCLRCHGDPARPNWDTYPLWPGAYGEKYHSALSEPEQKGILDFLKRQPEHPRYRYLRHAEIYSDPETFNPSHENKYNGRQKISPNESLSRLLGLMNFKKILHQLSATSQFHSYQYALLGALDGDCGAIENFIPEKMRAVFLDRYKTFSLASIQKTDDQDQLKKMRSVSFHYQSDSQVNSERVMLSAFRFLVEEGLGLSTNQWSTALEKDTDDYTLPQPAEMELEKMLLRSLVAEDKELAQLVSLKTVSNSDRYCAYIQKKSISSLTSMEMTFKTRKPSFPSDPQGIRLNPKNAPPLLATCIACHDGSVGPALPFARPEQLEGYLSKVGYPRGTLFQEILFRLSRGSGSEQMPRGINISESDRKALISYFQGLKSAN